jgi:hypothetical protein
VPVRALHGAHSLRADVDTVAGVLRGGDGQDSVAMFQCVHVDRCRFGDHLDRCVPEPGAMGDQAALVQRSAGSSIVSVRASASTVASTPSGSVAMLAPWPRGSP